MPSATSEQPCRPPGVGLKVDMSILRQQPPLVNKMRAHQLGQELKQAGSPTGRSSPRRRPLPTGHSPAPSSDGSPWERASESIGAFCREQSGSPAPSELVHYGRRASEPRRPRASPSPTKVKSRYLEHLSPSPQPSEPPSPAPRHASPNALRLLAEQRRRKAHEAGLMRHSLDELERMQHDEATQRSQPGPGRQPQNRQQQREMLELRRRHGGLGATALQAQRADQTKQQERREREAREAREARLAQRAREERRLAHEEREERERQERREERERQEQRVRWEQQSLHALQQSPTASCHDYTATARQQPSSTGSSPLGARGRGPRVVDARESDDVARETTLADLNYGLASPFASTGADDSPPYGRARGSPDRSPIPQVPRAPPPGPPDPVMTFLKSRRAAELGDPNVFDFALAANNRQREMGSQMGALLTMGVQPPVAIPSNVFPY